MSFETSLPLASVLNPRIRSGSEILKVSVNIVVEVPPIVTFPVTFKFRLTCKSVATVTVVPGSVGLSGIDITGVEPSPVPLVTVI